MTRRGRGNRTQTIVAQYLQVTGWPYAESTGSGRSGSDVTGTPDLAVEVKARANLNPLAWLKQTEKAARPGQLPIVVFRCNGQGEDVAQYPVLIRFGDLIPILRAAGYGNEET